MMTQTKQAIGMLLTAWPSSSDDTQSLHATLRVYELALDGIRPDYIERAVKAFIQGRVPDHDKSFRPNPPRLAEYARALQDSDERVAEITSRVSGQNLLTNEWKHEQTPEERAAFVERKLGRKPKEGSLIREPEYRAVDRKQKPWDNKAILKASMARIRAAAEREGNPIPTDDSEAA